MDEKKVLLKKEDGIATITFHRPEAMNALNVQVLNDLEEAVDDVAADPEVRVIVFTGEGKAFIAGADTSTLAAANTITAIEYSRRGANLFRKIERLNKPTISAINGYTFGGGFEFALCTDILYASEKASFALPEATLGITPGFNGTLRLPRVVGMHKAKELIFTGRRIKAAEAYELGILNKVTSPETLMDEVYALAKQIADNSAIAIMLDKGILSASESVPQDVAMDIELGYMASGFGTPDQIEGFAALKEKRKANFRGL
jgi:enoyl-CoA hydratase